MKLYITRHGETEWNLEGRMQGWQNSDLTEKGVENAKRLGKRLKDIE
ncbi:MAG: phosphoglycerate mutase family protein, partial [Pseudomonadota bacterium]